MPVVRMRAVVAVGVLAVAMLSGCAARGAPDAVCVPQLSVTPADPHPGRIVTVTASHPCPVALPEGATWKVRIQPDGARIPLAQASVRPDDDGSFELSITVPPTMPEGAAIVWISNYRDYVPCPETGACAAAEGHFMVGERLG